MRTKLINENDMEICPKCHEMGIPHHMRYTYKSRKPNKAPIPHHYLEYLHKDGDTWKNPKRCYLGSFDSLKGTDLYEILEKKDNDKAHKLERDIANVSREIREYLNRFSPKSSRRMEEVTDEILTIMEKWGF